MIEKLNTKYIHVESDSTAKLELANKINELVDAVNSLRDDCNLLMEYIAPENKCESAENGKCAKNAQDETLKCPFCQQELKIAGEHTTIMSCFNGDCKGSGLYGEKEFWQELIRTRKALGFAKSKLNGIHRLYSKAFYTREDWLQVCMEMVDKANTALDKIKALEQKE